MALIQHLTIGNSAEYPGAPDTTVPILFTRSEAFEIYHALHKLSLENLRLRETIGPHGRLLASGAISLGLEQARLIISQLKQKRDAVRFGWYDDYKGEIEVEGSTTQTWAAQLEEIISKLESITQAS
jgi:hypothetical protein